MLKIVFLVLMLAGCCGPGDAACTQAQYDALGGVLAGSAAPQSYHAPQPVFVGCTRTGNVVNCIGQ